MSSTCCTGCAGSMTPITPAAADRVPGPAAAVLELRGVHGGTTRAARRAGRVLRALDALRGAPGVREDLFAFPGPFIRELVHCLDGDRPGARRDRPLRRDLGRGRAARRATSPPAPTCSSRTRRPALRDRAGARARRATCSRPQRLDGAKRDRPADRGDGAASRATSSCGSPAPARRGRSCASWPPATSGSVRRARRRTTELAGLYADARAVAFVPLRGGLRLVTLEAMRAGRPVITASDSGGPRSSSATA